MKNTCNYAVPLLAFFLLGLADVSLGQELNRARVLIIGVEDYDKATNLAPLPGAAREARELKQLLVKLHVPESKILLLTSSDPNLQFRPTRVNIDHYLNWMCGAADPEELLLVLFTGHGLGTRDASYLCPMDTTDAALEHPSQQGLISVGGMAARMSQSRAKRKLLIVDACRNLATAGSFVTGLKKPAEGVWIMSSCSQGQVAAMESGRSLFWQGIKHALSGDADLLGNNNGSIGLFELYSTAYAQTRERAEALKVKQTPELFGGLAPPFEVLATTSFVHAPQFFTTDIEMERRLSASALAQLGVEHVRRGEQAFRDAYRQYQSRQMTMPDSVYSQHHQVMSYALSQYLEPALAIDDACRTASLGQGWIYRSCGMYSEALAAYQRAGERLEVFVKGDRRGRDAYLESNERFESHQVFGRTERGVELTKVILRAEGRADADEVARADAHAKLHVAKIEGLDPENQWLLVTHVNDNPLETPGWLPRSAVHWFAEAADVYTPAAPLGAGGGAGGGLARFDEAATGLESLADTLDAPARRLDEISSAINSAPAVQIASRFGFSVPGLGYINSAAGYARIPGNYVRVAGGYARMPSNYYNMARSWAGATDAYFYGQDRALATEGKHLQLRTTAPVRRQEIELINAPWDL